MAAGDVARVMMCEPASGDSSSATSQASGDDEVGEFEDVKTAGAVVVQEHGCGFSTLLAVTGPLAGTVWWDGRATCDRIVPLSPDHLGGARPVRFAERLEHRSWALLPSDWPRHPLTPVVPRRRLTCG
ncbi:SMI1/KNR4 family protein [Streptomyces sp. DSM 15324]|uniref:SMI1/KNR4 family protein n=1 Tax=Streptomyces sp. DSM 15324 TaxID=1739111 RepID=UPI001F3B3BC2|nr:SMI1/KNR4 family protein [Streptomyces sp. DSM 15324]